MKHYLTLRTLLLAVATAQLLALWVYGLCKWTVGTLMVSTLWLMLVLWVNRDSE